MWHCIICFRIREHTLWPAQTLAWCWSLFLTAKRTRKKVTSEILCLIWHYNSVAIRCLQISNPIQSKTWGFHGSEDSYEVLCVCGAMRPVGRDHCFRGTDSLHVPLKCWYLAPRLLAATTQTVFNSAPKINKYFWIYEWFTNIFSSYIFHIWQKCSQIFVVKDRNMKYV